MRIEPDYKIDNLSDVDFEEHEDLIDPLILNNTETEKPLDIKGDLLDLLGLSVILFVLFYFLK